MPLRPLLSLLIAASLTLSVCPRVQALLVDWDTLTWVPGDLTNSYDLDSGTPGKDVTITVSEKPGTLTTDSVTGIMTPNIGMAITGGLSPVENSFEIAGNLFTNSKLT